MITVLDFYADWCGPCKQMDPILHDVEKELTGKMNVERIDVDADTIRASEFGVMSIPTFVVMKDGKEVGRMVGYLPKEEFVKQLSTYL
ncbi:MAG: thioredoxin domain-containing protein [bacterium]|nr:thioredoxin domain-containing protein [bacterium]